MTYILVNSCEIIQRQFKTDDLKEAEEEMHNRASYDCQLLKSFYIDDPQKVYNNYSICSVNKSSNTLSYRILNTFKYDVATKTLKQLSEKTQNVSTPLKVEKLDIGNMFGYADELVKKQQPKKEEKKIIPERNDSPPEMCMEQSSLDSASIDNASVDNASVDDAYVDGASDYEDLLDQELPDDIDNKSELEQFRSEIQRLKMEREKKVKTIEAHEEEHDEIFKEVVDERCELHTKEKKEILEKEKLERQKRKFENDKKVYLKVKADIQTGDLTENNVPILFRTTYKILKELEDNEKFDVPNAFEEFMKIYTKVMEEEKNKYDANDPYGIF